MHSDRTTVVIEAVRMRHAPACVDPRNCFPPPQPEKVTAEQLEVELGDRQKPLIIDFYATWCGPCVLLAKELEQACLRRPLPAAPVLSYACWQQGAALLLLESDAVLH